jgi:hypothetical protein
MEGNVTVTLKINKEEAKAIQFACREALLCGIFIDEHDNKIQWVHDACKNGIRNFSLSVLNARLIIHSLDEYEGWLEQKKSTDGLGRILAKRLETVHCLNVQLNDLIYQ